MNKKLISKCVGSSINGECNECPLKGINNCKEKRDKIIDDQVNYLQVGKKIECGHCHPEKFAEGLKELERVIPNYKCDCICHDIPQPIQKEGEVKKSIKLRLMGKNHSDELYTPESAFDLLKKYIPKRKTIFECAVGSGKLKIQMERNGYNVVFSDDFFNEFPEYDILITNPPFSLKDKFLEEAYKRGKPFALLLPITALEGIKRQEMYKKYGIEILFPPKRIDFNGKKAPWFYVAWFCWKLLPKELNYE